ncbi:MULTISPECIES: ATP-binding protein [unclassified Clostridium]|uniref:ATP-binding protein n=1 Tax=unclassified Clostridium TaxID=2614128 RepID=UPI0002981B80|nr:MULTISPECIES: ATP-binding protein [unclassified Clostridium]EKQ58290.1 MAG: putative regulator of cell autolysis [Clostridium sp. Maddingley MBC34-26]
MKVLKNRTSIIFLSIFFILLLFLFNIYQEYHKKQLQAEKGSIDLTSWNFEKDGVISLDGEWEFYWNQLLTEDDFKNGESIKPDGYFRVPSVWTNYISNNAKFPEQGYATYRLKVKTDDLDSLKGLKILTTSTSYKLMVNEKIVAENGVVGITKETSVPEYRPQAVSFQNTSKEFDIIVQVSNFTYSRGGIWHSIYLGSDQGIRALKEFNSEKDMFMLGVVAIMSLYHIALFLIQKRDKSALYFALVLVVTAIRTAITGEYVILNFIPSADITWMVPLEYMTIYWGLIMAMAFVNELYPKEVPQKVTKATMYAGIILSIFTISVQISTFTRYLIYYEILIGTLYCYITFSVMKAAMKKREGASLLLLGSIIILIAYMNDVLYYWNVIYDRDGPSMEAAVFIVIFIQAYILAARFSLAFKKVEKLSEKLISLDKLKDEFLVSTNYELITSLNGIINIVQSLLKGIGGQLNLSQEENLQIVLASLRRLYNLINDVLDISNLAYNSLKLHPKPLDIRMIVESVIFVLEYLKGEKNIVFINLTPKDAPAVLCDEERLGQIFYNILENALRFTENGSITIKAEFSEDTATIFVENEGTGIKNTNLDSIYNSFEQEKCNKSGKYEGTSLGLSIAKQLIELQGGTVGIKSQHEKSPCFLFTLPLAKRHPEKVMEKIQEHFQAKNIEGEEINNEKILDKYNILAIEYDTVSLKVLINNLNLYGYTVKGVGNGYDALKLVESGIKFDVVIIDIMMPGISGYDILKKIREQYLPVELPVLLLTTSKRTYEISTGFRLGANDYLTKPFEPEELNARVKSLIDMKKAVNKLIATELSFLQAQIKPHFIYNALSVISSLSLIEPEKAKELILNLSDYLRGSFEFESKNGLTTLKRELNLVKSYLAIEQARFKERICVEFEVEVDDLIDCTVPVLCIQPLVENAVRHGIMPMIDGGKVEVNVKDKGEYIKISISDTGIGISEAKLHNILLGKLENGSIGIKNIHKRLMKLYGKGITIKSKEGNGTIVEFEVPYSENRRNEHEYSYGR